MKSPKKEPPIKAFASPAAWEAWLAQNHSRSDGLWLEIFKKDSALPTVTHAEALEICLCYGWIDGQRKGFDGEAFLQKFTPRRKGSIWSKINRDKALLLIREKRMHPAGFLAIEEAKKNGRWKAAYTPQSSSAIPHDLQAAFKKHPAAAAFFETLKSQNRYAILFRIQTCKKAETRLKKIRTFVEMLKAGKTLYPQTPKKS